MAESSGEKEQLGLGHQADSRHATGGALPPGSEAAKAVIQDYEEGKKMREDALAKVEEDPVNLPYSAGNAPVQDPVNPAKAAPSETVMGEQTHALPNEPAEKSGNPQIPPPSLTETESVPPPPDEIRANEAADAVKAEGDANKDGQEG